MVAWGAWVGTRGGSHWEGEFVGGSKVDARTDLVSNCPVPQAVSNGLDVGVGCVLSPDSFSLSSGNREPR